MTILMRYFAAKKNFRIKPISSSMPFCRISHAYIVFVLRQCGWRWLFFRFLCLQCLYLLNGDSVRSPRMGK